MASGDGVSAKNVGQRDAEESSESDGETEPAKSFRRRLSTNREIKCSVRSVRKRQLFGRISTTTVVPACARVRRRQVAFVLVRRSSRRGAVAFGVN